MTRIALLWLLAVPLAVPVAGLSIGIGSSVPDFTLSTLDGEHLTLSERRGESPLVLVFFRGAW